MGKKVLSVGYGSLAVACLGVVLFPMAWAGADSENAAVVIHEDGECGMAGSDEDGQLVPGGLGEVTVVIVNRNWVILKCGGSDIQNLSGEGQHYAGFDCGITTPSGDFVITTDTHATVSDDGHATLTCRLPVD